MERVYTIGLDVHCAFTELVVLTPTGRMRERHRSATTIPALVEQIERAPHPRAVVLEEGPMADWLGRGLAGFADDLAICDPRRNHLVAKDSDKDDPIDAEKLARLYQGGFIKRVHHPESFDRVVFKRHVGLYHESVGRRVRAANRIMGELRAYGVFVQERAFAEKEDRDDLWRRLPDHPVVRADIRCLLRAYDATVTREDTMRRSLVRLGQTDSAHPAVPGVAWGEVDSGGDVLRLRGLAVAVQKHKCSVEVPGRRPGALAQRGGPRVRACGQARESAVEVGDSGSGDVGRRFERQSFCRLA